MFFTRCTQTYTYKYTYTYIYIHAVFHSSTYKYALLRWQNLWKPTLTLWYILKSGTGKSPPNIVFSLKPPCIIRGFSIATFDCRYQKQPKDNYHQASFGQATPVELQIQPFCLEKLEGWMSTWVVRTRGPPTSIKS